MDWEVNATKTRLPVDSGPVAWMLLLARQVPVPEARFFVAKNVRFHFAQYLKVNLAWERYASSTTLRLASPTNRKVKTPDPGGKKVDLFGRIGCRIHASLTLSGTSVNKVGLVANMGPSSATLSLSSESQGVQTAEAILERCHHLPRHCELRDTAPRGPARLSKWCFSSHLGCLTTAQTNVAATSYSKNLSAEIFLPSLFKSGELLALFACCLGLAPPSETEQSRGKSDNKTVPGNDHRSMSLSGNGRAQWGMALGSGSSSPWKKMKFGYGLGELQLQIAGLRWPWVCVVKVDHWGRGRQTSSPVLYGISKFELSGGLS
ncbi:uncharacterized protein CLUP02_14783 [Colletotrichum lupini]|uniref:Uncharacterized protein n=1 Tax=Colletotrichum lupini TaxID=145971 RepID=A0A9Q8T4U1_9PEZI|nr:uncharacterized protein CLUP02_14783 [Colletotrichum lupini]UQC89254.1 hypothetical protein CLUP02_14783 [Colletotrichum lupini]